MQIIETNLPTNGSFKRRNRTDEIILHHAEASHASVEEVNRWHLERRVDRHWLPFLHPQGRQRCTEAARMAVGARAQGHNSRAIGICVEGSYMTSENHAAGTA